ncbi:NUDIX domain-containing protein [Muricoccus pecuniae]|uniref:ADP-ribose pyrophosphatase YjhB (NUDIX family) n=1 Tax=Muricoccus pecuniae TaxID=693023 RepID=A0A840YHM7_9PROT|nr:NUDIX domain-containing protein [Roseomonas pecuniae]MBB5694032.1 ADP-ribose pyrophosphatase YjhB (NUDIX family) [Roseomonas pecuniae]
MPGRFERIRQEGDDRDRLTCRDCGYVAYENPKVVVGSVVAVEDPSGEDAVLLCRRAIEPRSGFWTLPAGYLEMHETVEEGARREAWEEACARIRTEGVLAVYSIARLGQVQVMFRARLEEPGYAAGPESLEVRAFPWASIPWDEIAFPTVRWALNAWREGAGHPGPAVLNPPEDQRGTRPLPGHILAGDAG